MPLHDVSYKHWDGPRLGVWRRRAAIARNGLAACLQIRWMMNLVVLCWGLGLAAAAILFLAGQLLVDDSAVAQWVSTFVNPLMQNFARLLTSWLKEHPEISVGTTQNVLFYYLGFWLMRVSIFALGPIIPLLITRDLACNAIVIYSSKAVTRGDYLLGKFATVFGFLAMTWLGPVCAAWFLGNLLAPEWTFFWHARFALQNILIYGFSGMVVLSVLALGVSASSSNEKSTTALWFTWWILGGVIAPIAQHTRPWLSHLAFAFNINQIGLHAFRVSDNINSAATNIPMLGTLVGRIRPETRAALEAPNLTGAIAALLVMLLLAAFVVRQRVKPE
jgi:hypothetical protein